MHVLNFAIVVLDEEPRQGRDVLDPFAEGRHCDLNHIQTEIEILAERSFVHRSRRFLLVAATTRKSSWMSVRPPSLRKVRSSQDAQQLA